MARWLNLLIMLAMLAGPLLPATPAIAEEAPAALAETTPALVPLPRSCGGGLPPTADTPACCLFGYVYIDGQAVAEARVRVRIGDRQVEDWTGEGPDSDKPYFRLSLSDAPLSAQAGDTITIQVDYGNHQKIITHQVLNGAQQVDVVLPQRTELDYVFDREIWRQQPAGQLTAPKDVVVDGQGNYYVLDTINARVQVFNSERRYLYQWGSMGNAYGQFIGSVTTLTLGANGDVYIADAGNNRVQQFTRNGAFVRSWRTGGDPVGAPMRVAGIAADASGDIFVTNWEERSVIRFSATGELETSWLVVGINNRPRGIAVGPDNAVYVTDERDHQIRKYTRDGTLLDIWGGLGTANGQFDVPSEVIVDANNLIYVVDTDNNRIQKFDADGNWLTSWGSQGTGNGRFNVPRGIGLDRSGQLVVADTFNHRMQEFTTDGTFLRSWGQGGIADEQFQGLSDLTVDGADNLYTAESSGNRIQKYNLARTRLYGIVSRGAGNRQINQPGSVATDQAGNLYIADSQNHRVQKLTPDGSFLRSWGSQGTGNGQFITPYGITVGPDGLVYVADSGNDRIQVFNGEGTFQGTIGAPGTGPGQFDQPEDLAFDSGGNLYVLDKLNDRVQKFPAGGGAPTILGSSGPAVGQFRNPARLAVDKQNNVYITDEDNERITRFSPAGVVNGVFGFAVGRTQFINPTGLAFDSAGHLYLGDKGNDRVQIWRPMGFTRPLATLSAISARSVVQGQEVGLYGMGADSDQTQDGLRLDWFLDGSGTPFATGGAVTLPTANLTPGRHTIELRATDNEGEVSATQTTTIDVSPGTPKPNEPKRWTFLLYLDGDAPGIDLFLSRSSLHGALYRLEQAQPNARVTVAAIYDGPLPSGGDTFRYLIRPDGTFTQESLNEVNMGNPQTLVDFVSWGMQQAPADHVYLALADHANALDGIAWDYSVGRNERLTPGELRTALSEITDGGIRPIDVLHLDGCLMGLLEPAYQMRGLADYLVVSENLGWSAFAYDQYRALVGPQTTPAQLATGVADTYAAILNRDEYPFTISVLDMAQIDATARATDALGGELLRYTMASAANRNQVNLIRKDVQKLDSGGNLTLQEEDEYVDLDHWAELVAARVGDSAVQARAADVRARLTQLVVRNHRRSGDLSVINRPDAGYNLDNARGLGIYFPPRPSVRTFETYLRGDLHFVAEHRWDEFLATGLTPLSYDENRGSEPEPIEPLPVEVYPEFKLHLPITRR